MAQGMIMRRGGSSSLTVYAAASVGALPATAKNGDIGIITSDAITSFFVDNDALSSPAEGMVRIETTISNGAPVQLIPTVKIYPLRATQYLSSVWVYKDMRVRYGDAWVMPAAYLFYGGADYTAITGGLQARSWAATSSVSGQLPTITAVSGGVTVSLSSVSAKGGVYELASDVNLTNYTTLKIDSISNDDNSNRICRLYVNVRTNTYFNTSADAAIPLPTSRSVVSIDVSAINAAKNICVGVWAAAGTQSPSATIYRWWLE